MKIRLNCLLFLLSLAAFNTHLWALTAPSRAHQAPSCEFNFLVQKLMVTQGDVVTGLGKNGDVFAQAGSEIFRLPFDYGAQTVVPLRSKFNSEDFDSRLVDLSNSRFSDVEIVIKRPRAYREFNDGDPSNILKATVSGKVVVINHPSRGLIAIDKSGVVLKLPPKLMMMNAKEISYLHSYQTIFEGERLLVETIYGDFFDLGLTYAYEDRWPALGGGYYVGYPSEDGSGETVLASLDEFALTLFELKFEDYVSRGNRYYGWEIRKTESFSFIERPETNPISGRTKDHDSSLTVCEHHGTQKLLFTHSQGFGIFNTESGTISEKVFSVDSSIPVDFGVQALFDLKDLKHVAVVTKTGHLRFVDRNKLLDDSDPNTRSEVIGFAKATPGPLSFGNLGLGKIIKSDVVNNTIRVWYSSGRDVLQAPKSRNNGSRPDVYRMNYMEIDIKPDLTWDIVVNKSTYVSFPNTEYTGEDDFF